MTDLQLHLNLRQFQNVKEIFVANVCMLLTPSTVVNYEPVSIEGCFQRAERCPVLEPAASRSTAPGAWKEPWTGSQETSASYRGKLVAQQEN